MSVLCNKVRTLRLPYRLCSSNTEQVLVRAAEEHLLLSGIDDRVPKTLSPQRLQRLASLSTKEDRVRQLLAWGLKGSTNKNSKRSPNSDGGNSYDVLSKSLFLFRRMSDLKRGHSDPKLIRNWQLHETPRIVIDLYSGPASIRSFGFSAVDIAKLKRLTEAVHANRIHRLPARMYLLRSEQPDNLDFLGRDKEKILEESLSRSSLFDGIAYRSITHLDDAIRAGFGVQSKTPTIYLNPKARHVIRELDSDAVYVVNGAGASFQLLRERALSLKVSEARLPMTDFLRQINMRRLSLDRLISMMLDIFADGDWVQAIERHVPPITTRQYPAGFVSTRTLKRTKLKQATQEMLSYLA